MFESGIKIIVPEPELSPLKAETPLTSKFTPEVAEVLFTSKAPPLVIRIRSCILVLYTLKVRSSVALPVLIALIFAPCIDVNAVEFASKIDVDKELSLATPFD